MSPAKMAMNIAKMRKTIKVGLHERSFDQSSNGNGDTSGISSNKFRTNGAKDEGYTVSQVSGLDALKNLE